MLVAGMSVVEFAKAVGVDRQAVYYWLDGTYQPSSLARKQIARVAKKIKKELEKEVRP